jgi:FAD/FMN-containing dehydrogenase
LPWKSLRKDLEGKLIHRTRIFLPELVDRMATFTDPQFLTHAGAGFSTFSGVAQAWSRKDVTPRAAVEVATAEDVQAVVKFATDHDLRLAVKATGHDFHARSLAAGSLLLWTHRLTDIVWRDGDFCGETLQSAMQVGAGVQFWQLYTEAQSKDRFVSGGTCDTVGNVGYTTGGGYGMFAKYFGAGASNVLEAEVVLANGDLVTATPCNEYAELLHAIRGGGGGTYGVIVSLTYRTYEMPKQYGYILATYSGKESELASRLENVFEVFRNLIVQDLFKNVDGFVQIGDDGMVQFNMKYINLSEDACNQLFAGVTFLTVTCHPIHGPMWTPAGNPTSKYGAAGNWYQSWESSETSKFWAQNQARFFKFDNFKDADSAKSFASSLQKMVESWKGNAVGHLQLAWQYGLGHGHPQALATFDDTVLHPDVADAVGTIKIVRFQPQHIGDKDSIGDFSAQQLEAHETLDRLLGPTGAYLNEAAFDQPDWKARFWGPHVPKLEAAKAKYDPQGLFVCHHCIGSESWDESGNCKVAELTVV